MFRYLAAFSTLVVCAFGGIPTAPKISAAIKDTTVNSFENMNVNLEAPFRFQDFVVGFRYALGNLKKAPESLFAKKSFDTPADGALTLESDYEIESNNFRLAARWASEQFGVSVGVDADTKHRLKSVNVKKTLPIWKDNTVLVRAGFDALKNTFNGAATVEAQGATVTLEGDSGAQDPKLTVVKNLDGRNFFSPSIRLRSGEVSYGYKRNWEGGSVEARFHPGERVNVQWRDDGAMGTWVTEADIPLHDTTKGAKVSFSREWNY